MTALYRTSTIRHIESQALRSTPPGTLMTRAARAVANAADELARGLPRDRLVIALVGPGNNGGDALQAASMLIERGYRVLACAMDPQAPEAEDARRVWTRWIAQAGNPASLAHATTLLHERPLIIDGLFGIGLKRPIAGAAAALVARLNEADLPTIAVDVPSGLDADTGTIVGGADGVALRASVTVTMIGNKPGLHTAQGVDLCGRVRVADLRITREAHAQPDGSLLDWADLAPTWPARLRNTHKGSYGSLLVIGGAQGMRGAALLAASGAQAAGIGKLFLCTPDSPFFDATHPQWMTRLPDAPLDGVQAISIGCGLGQSAAARQLLQNAIASPLPLAVDADALNLLASDVALADGLRTREAAAVLTPHPLEAARLLGSTVAAIQANRIESCLALAQKLHAVVILKGAGSIVGDAAGNWQIVANGSPALATAGSGDVLAGLLGALLAQGFDGATAAAAAASLHAAAGERWACEQGGTIGMAASELGANLRKLINRSALDGTIRC